jgi:hypothetical protein
MRKRFCKSAEVRKVEGKAAAMKAWLVPTMLAALAVPAAGAQSLEVIGYAGYLGEWELTATVAETSRGSTAEYSGPLTMKHVGICTQDGPEEKAGALRFQISASSSRLNATLSVAGVECTYSGQLSDSYAGTMSCPGHQSVPLKLWVK